MVFLSTYKNNRVFGRTFLKPQVDKMRAFHDYCFGRAWNMQGVYVIFGDGRFYCFFVPMMYFHHRYHHDRVDLIEDSDKVLIKRWGGTVESVRQTLTPGEQVISRNYHALEKYYSFFGSKDLIVKPVGCPLPSAEAH